MRFFKVLVFCFLSIIVFSSMSYAQLSLGGTPKSFSTNTKSIVPSVVMSEVNVNQLLAEDAEEEKLGVPMRFGFPFDVNYSLTNSGVWETLPDGWKIWRLQIEAPGAKSINLLYENFWLPEGARFYLYSEDRQMVNGAYSDQNNKEHGEFATSPVKGEVTILELNVPPEVSYPGEIVINRIVHDYRDILKLGADKDFGSSGSCNNNVNCPEGDDWQDQKRAVAMVILGSGTRWCSGSMVNNTSGDLTPYFLTADHCLGSSNTWIIMFNYESPNCSNINGPTYMTVQGTTLRASNSFSDVGLVELSESPPDSFNLYYAGWTAEDIAADSVVAIHHPAGDIKKISFDYDQVTTTTYLQTAIPGNGSHWRVGQWEDGTTEGGSSGSPIFDRNKRIIGQLHGGYASCASITADWYGKFSVSWNNGSTASTRLVDWLDPINTGALTLDGKNAAGISITHTPLLDSKDSLNPYPVVATIQSDVLLDTDSLFMYYDLGSGYIENLMTATANPDEFSADIPAQSPGTSISYYLLAVDVDGKADTTAVYTFNVIDYGLSLTPVSDTAFAASLDTTFYLMTVTNEGVYADDYSLTFSGNSWATSLWDETFTSPVSASGNLLGDESFNFLVVVEIPSSLYGESDNVTVTATSTGDGSFTAQSSLLTVSDGEPFTIPFTDDFLTTTVDVGKWVLNSGGSSNADGLAEPSAPYSLNLDGDPNGADTVMSQAIDLKNETNVIVRFAYQQTGGGDSPESGDDLIVEYIDSSSSWTTLVVYSGADPDMTEYVEETFILSGDAYHSGFRLRFRNTATAGAYDDWFVDDIFVGNPPAYEVSISPQFQSDFSPSADTAMYTIMVHNDGLNDDSYALSASGNLWDVSFFDGITPITSTPTIFAADSASFTVKVAVPSSALMADIDSATVSATSAGDNLVSGSALIATSSAGLPGGFPWYEPFPDDTIFTPRWFSIVGAGVSVDGLSEPSAVYSLNLDGGGDTATTQIIDLSSVSGVLLTYYYQAGGSGDAPEAGDNLVVQYKNSSGIWTDINTHDGGVGVMTSFEYASVGLPGDAYYGNFQVRFLNTSTTSATDDWFVDDVRIDYAPSMSYSNGSMVQTLLIGDTTYSSLTIDNAGPGGLNYSISVVPVLSKSSLFAQLLAQNKVAPARKLYPEGFDDYVDIKGSDDTRTGLTVDKNAGGPDIYGYFWIDSDEPGGPVFNWEDVSGSGVDIVADLNDDNYGGPYPLGFDFLYYGNTYNEIYIGSNGIIGFDELDMSSRFKTSLPTTGTPNNILCWMWDDLNPDDADNLNAHVYVDTTGGRCVIQFVDYPEFGAAPGEVINAEVILEADGTIIFQYLSIAAGFDILANAIGIENADGTDGLEVSYLSSYVHDNLAVKFTAPYRWLKADKSSGSLLATESDLINFEFTTGDLDTGVYQANIIISNNDPGNNPVIIPAELTVTDLPPYVCGDVDGNGTSADIADLVYYIDYAFGTPTGPAPPVANAADVNNDSELNIADIVYMVAYMFGTPTGPEPNCP